MLRTAWYAVRSVCGLVVIALYTVAAASWLIVLTRINPRSRQITPIMRSWGRLFLIVAGVEMQTTGAERLDPDLVRGIGCVRMCHLGPLIGVAIAERPRVCAYRLDCPQRLKCHDKTATAPRCLEPKVQRHRA